MDCLNPFVCNVVIDVDGSSARWLGFNTFDCCGPGSVPGWGTEVLQATQQGHQKKERCKTELRVISVTPLTSPLTTFPSSEHLLHYIAIDYLPTPSCSSISLKKVESVFTSLPLYHLNRHLTSMLIINCSVNVLI